MQQLEGCARTFGAEENRINRLIKQLPDDLPSLTAWLHEQHETFQTEQVHPSSGVGLTDRFLTGEKL